MQGELRYAKSKYRSGEYESSSSGTRVEMVGEEADELLEVANEGPLELGQDIVRSAYGEPSTYPTKLFRG
jgi:hypothetical protein